MRWEKEVEKTEKKMSSKEERRQIRRVALTNHIGKMKKKKRISNSKNNHKKPRNWTRQNKTKKNPVNILGLSEQQYNTFIRTGKFTSEKD